MAKVLITGGAGFIGSHTADLLLKKNYHVRILDNLSSKTHHGHWPKYLDKRIEKIKGDVRYKNHWIRALKGVDYVIHLAAWMDMMPEISKYTDTNTNSTALLYELIITKKLPIKKVVIASSQFVYGQGRWKCKKDGVIYPESRTEERLSKGLWDPICPTCQGDIQPLPHLESHQDPQNPYAISKYTQELIALRLGKLYSIPSVAMRYSIVHGPRQSLKNTYSGALRVFVLSVLNGEPLNIYEDGKEYRDFVSVYDVAKANVVVLESKKAEYQVFNVGGGKRYTIIQLAKLVAQALNKDPILNIIGFYRLGDTRHSLSSISKLKSLGWKPEISEEESIKQFVVWAKQNIKQSASPQEVERKMISLGIIKKSN